jgi:Zn finger protein HypA/HybF involved in hydrogenase expression
MGDPNPSDEELYGDVQPDDDSKPINVTRYDGAEIEYVKDTDVPCTTCNRATMKVRIETESTWMLSCPHCGSEHSIPNPGRQR